MYLQKNIHLIEIENHPKVFFWSFNNAQFQIWGINITKNVYRTKNLYTFLKNFFHLQRPKSETYQITKKPSSLNVLVYEPTLKCSSLCKKTKGTSSCLIPT